MEFTRKFTDPFWSTIECIQTCVKSSQGIGKHFPVPFRVTLSGEMLASESNLGKAINYDYKLLGQEFEANIKQTFER